MALTDDERRKVALYLKYPQAGRTGETGGGLYTVELTHKLGAALDSVTPAGETTVRALLAVLDGLRAELVTMGVRMKATEIDGAKLNPKEWDDRMRQWNFFRGELGATLDVEVDPQGAPNGGAGAGPGPWREP
ncbi:MAG: hypothetical protein U0324_46955 [Polyangiales bacterium]